jgi:putative oxidoreductase
MDLGILIGRLVLGLAMSAHGAQKLFGWFGGYGLAGTGGFLETLGFRPGRLFAFALGFGELAAGLLTAAGFLGPIGPALIILLMLVAMIVVHWGHGFFAANNGVEVPALFAVGALILASVGPGEYSLDAWLGLLNVWTVQSTWAVVAAAVAGAAINLAIRRPAQPAH